MAPMIRPDLNSIPAYVPGARMPDALKLSSNESTHPPLPQAVQAMADAAATVNRYPDMGVTELRQALASALSLPGLENVAVGCGSSALCQQLVQISCTDGDEVVFAWRSFEAYPIFAQVVGATPVPVPLTKDHRHDLPAMLDAITDRTRLMFVCNPNNPTGTTMTRAEFEDFMRKVPPQVLVALDEAYMEYIRDVDTPLSTEYLQAFPNLVGLRTFSKAYGLAGARVGYAFSANTEVIDALNKVALPFGVNAVAQAGALASLAVADALLEHTNEVVAERARIAAAVGGVASQANFVWVPRDDAPEIAAHLADAGVLVRAFPEGLRITATTAEETERLLAAVDAQLVARGLVLKRGTLIDASLVEADADVRKGPDGQPVPTLLERDFNLPPLPKIFDELSGIRTRQARAVPARATAPETA